jgi:hypothetical protein
MRPPSQLLRRTQPGLFGTSAISRTIFKSAAPKRKQESPTDRAARSTARATWAIAVLTLVTIAVGISQYVTFDRQLTVMQDQLDSMNRADDTTRESIIAANRAWLAPQNMEVAVAVEDGTPKIMVHYQNIGRFPATDARANISVVAFPLARPIKGRSEYPATDHWVVPLNVFVDTCVKTTPLSEMNVVYPSGQVEQNGEAEMSGPWDKDDLLAGRSIMVVLGCFSYNTMGKTFHSGFCKYYIPVIGQPSRTWPALVCPVGNFDR